MTAVAINPTFGIQGKIHRIFSFVSNGDIYSFLNGKYYPGGVTERDELVRRLMGLDLLDSDFDPNEVVSGRYLKRKLHELSDGEVDSLLEVLADYC